MAIRDALPSTPAPQVATRVLPPPGDTVRIPASGPTRRSSRPTSHPDADPASIVEIPVARRPPAFALEPCPIWMHVPVRTRRSAAGNDIGHREAFVLMHVDGITEVVTIAKLVGLPVSEVLACFARLVDAGLIDLTIPEPALPGQSGVFRAPG